MSTTLAGRLRKKVQERRQAHLESMAKGVSQDQYWRLVGAVKEDDQLLIDIQQFSKQWDQAHGTESD